jgi:hypothetical protein
VNKHFVTVFANFRIDSEERFIRMCDSLSSFKSCDIKEWVINVRGSYKNAVIQYLNSKINKSDLTIFNLESKAGWFFDSKIMSDSITGDYVLFWIEDHILIGGVDRLNLIFLDLKRNDVDYLEYSWFGDGLGIETFKGLDMREASSLFFINYDKYSHRLRLENCRELIGRPIYIISGVGIFRKSLFLKLVNTRDPLFRRWSKYTPFDFEKRWDDTHWLPFVQGVPKAELFASIDDDNLYRGASMISRGLYPDRASRVEVNRVGESAFIKHLRIRLRRYPTIYSFASKIWRLIIRIKYQF